MKNFFVVTFWSIINKFLGLCRVQFTQKLLGASSHSDAFHLAFSMIGFFRRIFTDGSFYSFFTSNFALKDESSQNKNFGFALGVILVFSSIFLCISILFFLFPLPLTKLFTMQPVTTPKILLVSQYAKYMFPIAISMFLCSVFTAILNSYGEFFHSSFGLVVGSICNVSILYLGLKGKYIFWYFVIGTLSYSTVHALYMGIIIYNKYYTYSPPIFRREFFSKISITGAVQIINQILFILMNFLFVRMKAGGYSYVQYSERLSYFVFVLTVGNLSDIIAPALAKIKENKEEFQEACERFFSMAVFLVIFPAMFMYIHHGIIVKAIYTSNTATNLNNISIALKYVSIGTPFWCFQRLLLTFFTSRGSLSQQNASTLMYNIVTFLSGVFLYRYDFIGIVWSMNIGVMVVVSYLFFTCYRQNIFHLTLDVIRDALVKIVFCSFLLTYVFTFYTSTSMLVILLKALFCYIIYCLFCYKDIQFFLKNRI